MEINGTIFSKPQQDQLKRAIENIDVGMTLNKYTVTLSTNGKLSSGKVKLINRIISNAKSYVLYRGKESDTGKNQS